MTMICMYENVIVKHYFRHEFKNNKKRSDNVNKI